MKLLTQERLKELLHYEPETGIFTHQITRYRVKKGQTAGSMTRNGYVLMKIDGGKYLAHRLAWFYVNGEFPKDQIDHIDGVKTNNSISNLREATNGENMSNIVWNSSNTSGAKGVSWCKRNKKWRAYVKKNRKFINLGLFVDVSEAAEVASQARIKLHGAFSAELSRSGINAKKEEI